MIIKPSEILASSDSRFKRWGKLMKVQDVDLTQKNGYSLKGQFVSWEQAVSLNPGEYLVCAAETGSRNNHSYDYALVRLDEAGAAVCISSNVREDGLLVPKKNYNDEILLLLPEDVRAKAANSMLYKFAAIIVAESKMVEEKKKALEAPPIPVVMITGFDRIREFTIRSGVQFEEIVEALKPLLASN